MLWLSGWLDLRPGVRLGPVNIRERVFSGELAGRDGALVPAAALGIGCKGNDGASDIARRLRHAEGSGSHGKTAMAGSSASRQLLSPEFPANPFGQRTHVGRYEMVDGNSDSAAAEVVYEVGGLFYGLVTVVVGGDGPDAACPACADHCRPCLAQRGSNSSAGASGRTGDHSHAALKTTGIGARTHVRHVPAQCTENKGHLTGSGPGIDCSALTLEIRDRPELTVQWAAVRQKSAERGRKGADSAARPGNSVIPGGPRLPASGPTE